MNNVDNIIFLVMFFNFHKIPYSQRMFLIEFT